MASGVIGKLTLDVSDIEKKVNAINNALGKIGKNAQVKISIADEVKKQISQIYDELQKGADRIKDAAANVTKSMQAVGTKVIKDEDLKRTVEALKEYYNLMAKAENARGSQNLGSQAMYWHDAQEALKQVNMELRDQAEAYKVVANAKRGYIDSKFKADQREQTRAIKETTQAWKEYSKAQQESTMARKEADTAKINEAKQAYLDLTLAIKNYNAAKKEGDEAGVGQYQAEIDLQMQKVAAIEQAVSASNMEASAQQQVLNIINQCKTAEHEHAAAIAQSGMASKELEGQIAGIAARYLSIMAVVRAFSGIIQNSVEYVTEFSDKMNEIQIITQKSDAEVDKLGETYKQIAQDMNVSTLDMADAAIYFTRQGLAAEEIEQRLKNVTMYAKTANVEFKESSEIITAVVNSMNLAEEEMEDGRNATQRVADVFLAVGDSAATSGEEIGKAMQKAAASAGAFGVSFEWLASAIATVSETTRQEARTIGTAFNTIIARLHQIKQSGYNADDETKINDVAKALSKIDVALMDNAGNWRNMEDVWNDIASKWGDIDDKTRSYIATTMAGVKQQNVFLAAMNDMSQKVEEGGRFWELYEIAMNSAGTAEEKYATWTDSVAASQERLNLAQERFYAQIMNDNVIKTWNDALAGVVNMLANGAEAFGSWTIILPVIAGAITAVTVALVKAAAAAGSFAAVLSSHPVILGIGAGLAVMSGLLLAINGIGDAVETQKERVEKANKTLTESKERIDALNSMSTKTKDMFSEIGDDADGAGESLEKYNELLKDLSALSPEAKRTVDNFKEGLIDQKQAAEELNQELERQVELQTKINLAAIRDKYAGYKVDSDKANVYNLAQSWNPIYTQSLDNLAKFLQKEYEANDKITYESIGIEGARYIEEQLKALSELEYEDRWPIISQRFWEHFFGLDKYESVDKVMTDQVMEMVDDLYNAASASMDDVDKGIFRQSIMNALLGDDEQASYDEWKAAGGKISKMALDMYAQGFVPTAKEKLQYIVKSVFEDNLPNESFGDDYIASLAEVDPQSVNEIVDAYKEILAAGFEGVEIADFFDQNSMLSDLKNMVDLVKNAYKDEIQSMAEEDNQVSLNFLEYLDQMDLGDLKLIKDLMDLDVAMEDIEDIASQSTSFEEFIQKLRDFGKENGIEQVAEGTENAAMSLDDYVKEIQNAKKDIDSLTEAISKTKKGKKLELGEVLGLAEAHPEILSLINDTGALNQKLIELKESAKMDLGEKIQDLMLNSGAVMAASPFSQNITDDIQTLQDYIDSLDEGSEEYASVTAWLDQASQNLVNAAEEIEKPAEKTDTWLQTKVKELRETEALAEAKKNNFRTEIQEILDIADTAGRDVGMTNMTIAAKLFDQLKAYPEALKSAVMDAYPDVAQAFLDIETVFNNSELTAEQKAEQLRTLLQLLINAANQARETADAVTPKTLSDIEKLNKDIKLMDETLEKIDNGEPITADDMFDIVSAHPELMSVIGDMEQLKNKIQEIKEQSKKDRLSGWEDVLWNSEEYMGTTKWAETGFKTLKEYADTLPENSAELAAVASDVEQTASDLEASSDSFAESEESWLHAAVTAQQATLELKQAQNDNFREQIKTLIDAFEKGGVENMMSVLEESFSADMRNGIIGAFPQLADALLAAEEAMADTEDREGALEAASYNLGAALYYAWTQVPENAFKNAIDDIKELTSDIDNLSDVLEKMQKGESLSITDIFNLVSAHPELINVIGDLDQLENKIEEIKETAENDRLTSWENLLWDTDYIKQTEWANKGYESLKAYYDAMSADPAEQERILNHVKSTAEALDEASEHYVKAEKSMLESHVEARRAADELEAATKDNYKTKLKEMIDMLGEFDELADDGGASNLIAMWESMGEKMTSSIEEAYPGVEEALYELQQAMQDTEDDGTRLAAAFEKVKKVLMEAFSSKAVVNFESGLKEVKDMYTEIKNLDDAIEKIKSGEGISPTEMFDLVNAHPELLTVIGDLDKFQTKLEAIRNETQKAQEQNTRNMILDSEKMLNLPEWSDVKAGGYKSLREYAATLDADSAQGAAELARISAFVDTATQNLASGSDFFKDAEKTWLETEVEAQQAQAELEKAQKDNFKEKIKEMMNPDEGMSSYEVWNQMGQNMKKAFGDAYPEINKAMLAVEQAKESGEGYDEAMLNLGNALKVAYASIPSDQLENDLDKINETETDINNLDNAIKTLEDGEQISFSDMLNLVSAHPEIMTVIGDVDLLKAKLAELRGDQQISLGESIKNMLWNSSEFMQSSSFARNYNPDEGINNLKQYAETIDTSTEEGARELTAVSQEVNQAAGNLEESAEKMRSAAEDWLAVQVAAAEASAELEWAKTNEFVQQVEMLENALGEGGPDGVKAAMDVWNSFDESLQKSISQTYPELAAAILDARDAIDEQTGSEEKATKASGKLTTALSKTQRYLKSTAFKDTYKAVQQLEKGTTSVTKAYEAFNKDLEKVEKAAEEVSSVTDKLGDDITEIGEDSGVTADDVANLADVLGMTPEQILEDWPGALEMFDQLTGAAGDMQAALDALNAAAFIKITGVGEGDFSAITNGLMVVKNASAEAVKALEATGQWTTDKMDLPVTQPVWTWNGLFGGGWRYEQASGTVTVLKPTGNNPMKGGDTSGKGKGGGGGGGGGGKKGNEKTESKTDKFIDRIERSIEVLEYKIRYYEALRKMYDSEGKYQGSMDVLEKQKKELEKLTEKLEKYLKTIENKIERIKKKMKGMDKSSPEYKKLKEDLNKLIETQRKYSEEIIKNKTELNELNKEIEEYKQKIIDMEIDIKNEIYKAIEDRENKKKKMLSAEIDMENRILDIITKRYEKERDQIIDTTNMKIDALREERDLLEEQLQLRKEQAEQEDKAQKLLELEAQYQRISADPTRAKEAQKIREQINDLREEMAWDAAEAEVKAQQDSIDQQINSLEDYIDYINNYYDALFENPTELIKEMEKVMKLTDDELIEWLQKNDEEYQKATKNRQKQMTQEWQDELDDRAGRVKTYWKEVEEIYAKGEDEIIKFLKKNSEEYAKAGKLQAEKYINEWKKKIEELKKALEEVETETAKTEKKKKTSGDSGGDKKSGGGGGGGGGGGSSKPKYRYTATITYISDNNEKKTASGSGSSNKSEKDAKTNAENAAKKSASDLRTIIDVKFKAYKRGGYADYTGLAWVDGTKQNPEAVLNPYQTKLFETMVQAMDKMSKVSIPTMPNFGEIDFTGSGGTSIGDIIVNVDNLDTDDDYEELAKKVGEVIMERIGKRSVIGGLRLGSY